MSFLLFLVYSYKCCFSATEFINLVTESRIIHQIFSIVSFPVF